MIQLFFNEELHLILDDIKDPGNLGTILRIADWFGFKSVICSKNTVDVYNSKVVQSTMGALFRIPVIYTDLEEFLDDKTTKTIVTHLEGENIFETNHLECSNAFVVMGSESHGVSDFFTSNADFKVKIPSYGDSESLNVGVATGIICAEIKRRQIT